MKVALKRLGRLEAMRIVGGGGALYLEGISAIAVVASGPSSFRPFPEPPESIADPSFSREKGLSRSFSLQFFS